MHPIPNTHKTLGGALLSVPEPYPGTQYLLRSIETEPADPSVLFFCTHYSHVSYLESFIETLYSSYPSADTPFYQIYRCVDGT